LIREFRLSPPGSGRGVSCDANGAFFGTIPLLKRSNVHGKDQWEPRDCGELSKQIGSQFGLPIDIASKARGIKAISNALNAGDVARAQIATVLLGIPDPPPLTKCTRSQGEMIQFIRDLHLSGMINWNSEAGSGPRDLNDASNIAEEVQFRDTIAKAGFNPDEPRDERGRWTNGENGAEASPTAHQTYLPDGLLDDGVHRPDTDSVDLVPTASSPEQLRQNWQQHEDEVNRQVQWLEDRGYGAIKVTKNVSFIGRNGVRVTVDYVVSRWLPDGLIGFWLVPDFGADVKTGKGGLRESQQQVYPKIGSGTWVYPVGINAELAGFMPKTWVYFPIVYGDSLSTTRH